MPCYGNSSKLAFESVLRGPNRTPLAPYDRSTEELLSKMMPAGVDVPPLAIFRLLARLPKLGARLAGFGGSILGGAMLPPPFDLRSR